MNDIMLYHLQRDVERTRVRITEGIEERLGVKKEDGKPAYDDFALDSHKVFLEDSHVTARWRLLFYKLNERVPTIEETKRWLAHQASTKRDMVEELLQAGKAAI